VIGDPEDDLLVLLGRLIDKIRRALGPPDRQAELSRK
jgi:hypothetical protein